MIVGRFGRLWSCHGVWSGSNFVPTEWSNRGCHGWSDPHGLDPVWCVGSLRLVAVLVGGLLLLDAVRSLCRIGHGIIILSGWTWDHHHFDRVGSLGRG